jgi:hypothetical protein
LLEVVSIVPLKSKLVIMDDDTSHGGDRVKSRLRCKPYFVSARP